MTQTHVIISADTSAHQRTTVHGPRFPNLLRSERTKLRTLRSTYWALAITAVLAAGFSILTTSLNSGSWSTMDASARAYFVDDTIAQFYQPAFVLAGVAAAALGVLFISSEYTTGMIGASMLAAPRRSPMLAAKAVVLAVTVFVLAEAVAVVAFPIDAAIAHRHAQIGLGTPGTIRVMIGFGVLMAMLSLIGLALGALLRHTAGGLGAAFGVNLVLPVLLGFVRGSFGRYLTNATPEAAGQRFLARTWDSTSQVSPWTGFIITGVWTAALLAAAFIAIRRRDV